MNPQILKLLSLEKSLYDSYAKLWDKKSKLENDIQDLKDELVDDKANLTYLKSEYLKLVKRYGPMSDIARTMDKKNAGASKRTELTKEDLLKAQAELKVCLDNLKVKKKELQKVANSCTQAIEDLLNSPIKKEKITYSELEKIFLERKDCDPYYLDCSEVNKWTSSKSS